MSSFLRLLSPQILHTWLLNTLFVEKQNKTKKNLILTCVVWCGVPWLCCRSSRERTTWLSSTTRRWSSAWTSWAGRRGSSLWFGASWPGMSSTGEPKPCLSEWCDTPTTVRPPRSLWPRELWPVQNTLWTRSTKSLSSHSSAFPFVFAFSILKNTSTVNGLSTIMT